MNSTKAQTHIVNQSNIKQRAQVVIQTAFIGDVFLSIPFLIYLRSTFKNQVIVLVAKKGVASFLLKYQLVDHILEVRKGKSEDYTQVIKTLHSDFSVNQVYCLHKSTRSSFLAFRIKADFKFGFKNWLNQFIMTKTIEYPKTWPDPLRQLSLLSLTDAKLKEKLYSNAHWNALNFKNENQQLRMIPSEWLMPELSLRLDDLYSKLNLLNIQIDKNKKNIVLFPGSVWATKKWPIEYYIQLSLHLKELNYEVYIMGGSEELNEAQAIQKLNSSVHVLAGKLTLIESIEFLSLMNLIICNDSSPTHFSALLNKPTITLFGPTTLDLGFRPWSNVAHVLEVENLKCRPCSSHGPQTCPLKHHDCMKQLKVEMVLAKIQKII